LALLFGAFSAVILGAVPATTLCPDAVMAAFCFFSGVFLWNFHFYYLSLCLVTEGIEE
jgi:hypothetical protein